MSTRSRNDLSTVLRTKSDIRDATQLKNSSIFSARVTYTTHKSLPWEPVNSNLTLKTSEKGYLLRNEQLALLGNDQMFTCWSHIIRKNRNKKTIKYTQTGSIDILFYLLPFIASLWFINLRIIFTKQSHSTKNKTQKLFFSRIWNLANDYHRKFSAHWICYNSKWNVKPIVYSWAE